MRGRDEIELAEMGCFTKPNVAILEMGCFTTPNGLILEMCCFTRPNALSVFRNGLFYYAKFFILEMCWFYCTGPIILEMG